VRLSIFNSSWHLLAAILLGVSLGVGLTEAALRRAGLPLPEPKNKPVIKLADDFPALVLGDSRADTALVPSILAKATGCGPIGNLGAAGTSPINQLELLNLMALHPRLVLIAVSPASVYGAFYRDPRAVASDLKKERRGATLREWVNHPYDHSEALLGGWAKRHFLISLGFKGVRALVTGVPMPEYRGPDGWNRLQPAGEREAFLRMVNMQAYRKLALKRNEETMALRDKAFKQAFRGLGPGVRGALIRIPSAPEILAIEDERFPDFDQRMTALGTKLGLPYVGQVPGFKTNWAGTDWSHLTMDQAVEFSMRLAPILEGLGVGCDPAAGGDTPGTNGPARSGS
jgi:hypothetical protein